MNGIPATGAGIDQRMNPRTGSAVIAAAIALGVAGATWQAHESRQGLRAQVLEHSLATATLTSAVLSADLEGHLKLVEAYADRPSVVARAEAGDWAAAAVHLAELREIEPGFGSSALFDPDGHLVARDPADEAVLGRDFSSRDYFRGALAAQHGYLSEVFRQQGVPRATVVAFASVVRGPSGAVLGVLQATLPVEQLRRHARAIRLPNGGTVQIFDGAGHALTGPQAGPENTFGSSTAVARALAGHAGGGEMTLPGLPGLRLGAYAPVDPYGWAVVVEQPVSAAYRPVAALTLRLGGIGAIVLVVGVTAAIVTTRLVRRLERQHGYSAAILEAIADGVVIADVKGRVAHINPAMDRLTRLEGENVVGYPFLDLLVLYDARGEPIPPEGHILAKAIENRAVAAGSGHELALLTRDGRRLPVGITAAPVLDENGAVVGGVAVVRDASYEREVDQLKSSLISTVSHELRTPLTMIQGFSQLLVDRDLSEANSREALRQINTSSERLSRLIDDLLSVSRIEAGRLAVRPEAVDVREVAREVLASFQTREGRELRVEADDELPAVHADPDMFVQILTNLISNAIKYSPAGTPVSVAARRNGPTVEVAVEDRGIGLSEKDVARIFDKFGRADRPEVRKVSGTGLGLYITRNLVEMQGGQIWVRSEPGLGSTFSFCLPVAVQDRQEVAP